MDIPNSRSGQAVDMYRVFRSWHPDETPLKPDMTNISPGGVTRIVDIVRKKLRGTGWTVKNRMETVEGKVHSYYRLAPSSE